MDQTNCRGCRKGWKRLWLGERRRDRASGVHVHHDDKRNIVPCTRDEVIAHAATSLGYCKDCPVCGWRHQYTPFPVGSLVEVVEPEVRVSATRFAERVGLGSIGRVESLHYNRAATVTVNFSTNALVPDILGFMPCELELAETGAVVGRVAKPKTGERALLVAERGLANTRRNRRWLALVRVLDDHVSGQEKAEALAWEILKTIDGTR